jgi:predicted RNA-binding Zn ribbon-like protein
MTARVAFKKKKKVHECVVWIVSVFDNPHDISKYDSKTMTRIQLELYGKNSKAEKMVIIREILDKKFISNSTLSIHEHKQQNQKQVQAA